MSNYDIGRGMGFGLVMLALAVIIAALTGCTDRGKCLADHREKRTERRKVGNHYRTSTRWRTVCDQWEFPNGRPKQ